MQNLVDFGCRMDMDTKQGAEAVLAGIGMTMEAAIDLYLKQIILKGKIPFAVDQPMAPETINAEYMTADEIREALYVAEKDFEDSKYINVDDIKRKGI